MSQQFLADLHIHSKFSRATSKKLCFRNLAAWGAIKGLQVIGTGDFTHPGWLEMMEEELEQIPGGLFTLKQNSDLLLEVAELGLQRLPKLPSFLLSSEISSIYKKNGQVRKVHNLVFMPDLDSVKRFNQRLEQVGNLKSDGRPILGLDSKNLLEMVLETSSEAFLIPAHIWTPWFSLFGSKSGFNSIEECFEDLSPEIFALETGLSSDPEMNWMWSALDRFSLVSNSDAHSGANLGREANIFNGEMSYHGIFEALRHQTQRTRFLGTMEFFPEEGKYHLDGHRKCNIFWEPSQTLEHGGRCPVCGKPVTVGVFNRIMQLADRKKPQQPQQSPDFSSLIPLPEIISEILGVGPKSKKVLAQYSQILHAFGSEMEILQNVPAQDLDKKCPHLGQAIHRMRNGQVIRQPGFDGQYGVIRLFSEQERQDLKFAGRGRLAIKMPVVTQKVQNQDSEKPVSKAQIKTTPLLGPNELQLSAAKSGPEPVLVLAGPGTGKTYTLMKRVELLQAEKNPEQILVLTFTRRAAKELQQRLKNTQKKQLPKADTLHALALEYCFRVKGQEPRLLSENESWLLFKAASPELSESERKQVWNNLNLNRECLRPSDNEYFTEYKRLKSERQLVDYTDLLEIWLQQQQAEEQAKKWDQVLVDEVQDLSPLQLKLISTLLKDKQGQGFFAIGDPQQAIYGFRGAIDNIEDELKNLWPKIKIISLADNYRSGQKILDQAGRLFPFLTNLEAHLQEQGKLTSYQAASDRAEAQWIGRKVLDLIGGTAHWQADTGQEGAGASPEDIAILVRFKSLIAPIFKTLTNLGIPCSAPEQDTFWHDPQVLEILDFMAFCLGLSCEPQKNWPKNCERALSMNPQELANYIKPDATVESLALKQLNQLYGQEKNWNKLLNYVHLEMDLEKIRLSAQKVQIMTMHAAKGLEFDYVFLPALEQGIMPFINGLFLDIKGEKRSESQVLAEEKRLFYVALTRAGKGLYLSRAKQRKVFGNKIELAPSSFLSELDSQAMTRLLCKSHKKTNHQQLSLFSQG